MPGLPIVPYGRQNISAEDLEAVLAALRSDFLTQGPKVPEFERKVAEYCGAGYAVAVCNATAALHIACLAAGLGPGDRAWTSPNSFVASANCILYCGAEPGFIDIDPRTYNMDPGCLESALKAAAARNRLPKLIIPVHFSGQPCDMEAIRALADRYGIMVLEDASHALGASRGGLRTGGCSRSDMAVFSFHPVKMITTGEGGMILTNRKDLYERLIRLRSHGITKNPAEMEEGNDGPWHYQQLELGFNYRLTDLQAALGSSQLQRLPDFVARRNALAARYDRLLAGLPLATPYAPPGSESSRHLYVVRIDSARARKSRREVFDALKADGISANVHYIPIHTQPYYRKLGFRAGDYPMSEAYYRDALTLPLFFDLAEADQDRVVAGLSRALAT